MEDLRRCWKVPYIVYYCNLFEQKLDLIDLRVDEFEDALIDDCGNERNITIVHLLQKLLKPFINRSIDLTNFDQYLLQVLRRYHLDFILNKANREDNDPKSAYNSWNNLTMLAKLDIIFKLCELRLSLGDIENKLSDYEANELRLEPLAVDAAGTRLWYFGDLRLYEEARAEKKPKSKVVKKKVEKKPERKQARSTRSSRRLRAREELEEQNAEEEDEEEEEWIESDQEVDVEQLDTDNYEDTLRKELMHWSCLCVTLDDWFEVNERLKNSKKKQDQEIGELIESQYLPEMPALFQKAEREKQQRLQAMQPKRQSQRLQSKQVHSYGENELDMANDEFSKLPPEEQERLKREQIARAREERLKQRLAKRETVPNDSSHNDEISQDACSVRSCDSKSSDFNIKNYYLMYKVLQKLLQCKYSWPFKTAVSEDDAPDYNTIIENPMDLSTIQLKINNKIYKSRREFINDLELIVQNCLTYNGDDTFYGKLAVKFENFFKRWLQIFYPREISASLEEKNRQLMKLINGGDMSAENADEPAESQNDELGVEGGEDTNSVSQMNENSQLTENEATQPIDFSDTSFLNGTLRKKRKPNPEKDKYIQEPEYVTKRTSSGRLVKMKINNEFDYASDEDKEKVGPGRPRKRDLDSDDGTQEGIQRRHCKSPNQVSRYLSSSDSNESEEDDDDDFGARSKAKSLQKKTTRKYVRKRDEFGNLIPRRPKRTIADLTGPVTPGLAKIFENAQENSCIETKRNTITNTNILRQQSSNLNLQSNSEYSFEQYVKKINSNCTVGQALAVADAVKAACTNSPEKSQSVAPRLSLKINSASTSHAKLPLTIPVINPSIKATLGRTQQPVIVNNSNENNKVKLISLNGSSGGLSGKKLLIINSNASNQAKPVILNNGASNFKIINIKSTSSPVGSPRPIIMINKSHTSDQIKIEDGVKKEEGQEIKTLPSNQVDSVQTELPVAASVKNDSEVNGHVN